MTISLPTSIAESVVGPHVTDAQGQNATTGTRVSLSPTGKTSSNNEVSSVHPIEHHQNQIASDSHANETLDSLQECGSGEVSPMKIVEGDDVDPQFVLPPCDDVIPRKELEPVELFVTKAVLEQHQEQDLLLISTNYKGILDAFRFKRDLPMLRKLLIAFRTSGSTLSLLTSESNKHARLIHQLVRFIPFTPDTVTVATPKSKLSQQSSGMEGTPSLDLASQPCDVLLADAQFRLLFAIVSANSVFLVPTLTALWKMLTSQITDGHPVRCRYIHAAIATVLRLCPQAKSELFPIIASNAPFRMRVEAELIWYYKQSIHTLQYLPAIRDQVLELIVARCLELDVEIKITDVGEATIDTDNDDDAIFHLDLDDKEQTTPAENAKPTDRTVDEMADKLDSLMMILFDFAEHSLRGDVISAAEMFRILSRIFESAIIVTHKSKFVQFLILHICGMEARPKVTLPTKENDITVVRAEGAMLYREFAASLIDVVIDPYRATATRQSGACYLASFVSRASFVCVETVCEAVDALLRWAEAYMQSLVSLAVHAPDAREQCSHHSLFYTVCQAAYYIMCFRGTEVVKFVQGPLREDPNHSLSYVDLSEAKWTRICSHPLLPLRYCLESVRSEFLRISKFLLLIDGNSREKLMADDELNVTIALQRKKKTASRIMTAATLEKERVSGGVGGLGRGTNPLDSFFPFDPYLLRQSHRFIEPFYHHWDGGASEADVACAIDDIDDAEEDTINVVDTSDDDNESRGQSANDDSDDSDSDGDRQSETAKTRKRFMSFGSAATSVSSRPNSFEDKAAAGDSTLRRGEMKRAWSHVTKRTRAPSIENGSW